MTTSKTYTMAEGLNYIQSSDIIYTTVYLVKREGTQYDKYVSGDGNRTYIYAGAEGKIYFSTVANTGGENIFVLFKKTSFIPEPIPGDCVPVQIVSTDMPIALVGQPYVYTVLLSGSRPFTLSDLVAPSWMLGHIYSLTQARLFGTPDAESSTTVTFNITNGCGNDSFSKPLSVLSGTVNFYVEDFINAVVRRVDNLPYILTSGNIPTNGPIPVRGIHDAYTGTIPVEVSGIIFPLTLNLYRNGSLLESIPVPTNGFYVFGSQSYLSTDEIKIILGL